MFALLGAIFYIVLILLALSKEDPQIPRDIKLFGLAFFGLEAFYWVPVWICKAVIEDDYDAKRIGGLISVILIVVSVAIFCIVNKAIENKNSDKK